MRAKGKELSLQICAAACKGVGWFAAKFRRG